MDTEATPTPAEAAEPRELKSLKIDAAVHRKLRLYCRKHGLILRVFAERLISGALEGRLQTR